MSQEDAMNMSNEQAIQILKPFRDMMIDQHGCPISDAVFALDKAIEALSVQPEHRWIPCSERLPDNGRQVLVFARSVHFALAKYDEMREADGTYKKQWVTFDAWKPFYRVKDVIAWMELPEPWREEQLCLR